MVLRIVLVYNEKTEIRAACVLGRNALCELYKAPSMAPGRTPCGIVQTVQVRPGGETAEAA